MTRKIELTPKEEAWLLRNFCRTKNDEILERLQVSGSWLHRYAREHGLVKTRQFQKGCQAHAAAMAKKSHLKNGTYPPKGYIIPGSERYRFKPGHKETAAAKRRRVAKSTETRNRTIREERARVNFGVHQLTKLRLVSRPKKVIEIRWYLKNRGYHIERGSMVARYDETTRRCPKIEARRPGDPGYFAFVFEPVEARG